MRLSFAGALVLGAMLAASPVLAEPPSDPKAVKEVNGKWQDAKGDPTYNVKSDGTVDFYTFSGFRRYQDLCSVCHGPNGDGSTFAPVLKDSVKRFDYAEFFGIVLAGRVNKVAGNDSVMPSFADNKNATCYLDDIYVYLRARSTGAIGAGRPEKKDAKSDAFVKAETECMAAK